MRTQAVKPSLAQSCRSAFTLIEILCVVVILGICSAIIIPQLGSRDDLRVSAATRVVMADLMYAQNRAIATQKKHFVVFSSDSYALRAQESDSSPLTTITHPITKANYVTGFGSAATARTGLELCSLASYSVEILGFDELGAPFSYDSTSGIATALTEPATIQIGCGAQTLTISVESFTGETSVN